MLSIMLYLMFFLMIFCFFEKISFLIKKTFKRYSFLVRNVSIDNNILVEWLGGRRNNGVMSMYQKIMSIYQKAMSIYHYP